VAVTLDGCCARGTGGQGHRFPGRPRFPRRIRKLSRFSAGKPSATPYFLLGDPHAQHTDDRSCWTALVRRNPYLLDILEAKKSRFRVKDIRPGDLFDTWSAKTAAKLSGCGCLYRRKSGRTLQGEASLPEGSRWKRYARRKGWFVERDEGHEDGRPWKVLGTSSSAIPTPADFAAFCPTMCERFAGRMSLVRDRTLREGVFEQVVRNECCPAGRSSGAGADGGFNPAEVWRWRTVPRRIVNFLDAAWNHGAAGNRAVLPGSAGQQATSRVTARWVSGRKMAGSLSSMRWSKSSASLPTGRHGWMRLTRFGHGVMDARKLLLGFAGANFVRGKPRTRRV